MAGKLSFAIAINLMTDGFKNGVNSVKSYLRSMQMQFLTFAAALGAGGLGLSNLVSKFIEVARETNRVTTALKNVSGSLSQYSDNQKFLIDLSNKYGLEINALTGNFAKFTASARVSGMAMDEQKKIFESVSRACTAFGMSADDSNSTFLALSQMMSKGKISSEELRLQMGERLPIALQAMAKAAGVSVGGLDKLLKQGKLMSADVLPKFADALNEMIPTIDTDNIETSVNRLKNTFTDLTKSLHIGDIYKKVVDMSASELEKIKNGVSNVVLFIVSLISGKLLTSVLNYFKSLTSLSDSYVRQSEIAQAQILKATENRTVAEKVLNTARTDYETLENGKRLASKKQVINAELALERAKAAETKAITAAKAASEKASLVTSTTWYGKFFTAIKLGTSQALVALRSMWSAIAPMAILTALSFVIGKFIEMRTEANRIKKIFSEYKREAQSVTHTPEIIQLQVLLKLYNSAIEGSKLKEKYQNRIVELLGGELKKNQDINSAVRERIKLLEATAKVNYHTQKKITAEDKNFELASGIGLSADQMKRAANIYPLKNGNKRNKDYYYNETSEMFRDNGVKDEEIDVRKIDKIVDEFIGNLKIINHASSEIDKNTEYQIKNTPIIPQNSDSDDKKNKKTDLEKAEEEYAKDLKELANQKENAVINEKEYNYLLTKLNIETNKKLSGLLTSDQAAKNKTYQQTKTGLPSNSKTFEESHKYQEELDKLSKLRSSNTINEKEYKEELGKLAESTLRACAGMDGLTMADNAFITALIFAQKQLKEKVTIPKETPYDNTFDYKKTKPEILSDRKASKENRVNDLKSAIGKDAESLAKDISDANLSLEQLKAKYKNVSGQLVELLNNAMSNVKDLGEALKIAQVKEDIKNLSKEINKGIYGSVKDVVSVADNLYSSLENVKEVMNDVDASEWKKFMSVWNAIISTTDGILSTIETIKSLIKMVEELTQAKQKEQNLENAAVEKKIANSGLTVGAAAAEKTASEGLNAAKGAEMATDTLATNTKVSNAVTGMGVDIAASGVKKTTATENIQANTSETASEAAKGAAKLPFPFNLIAIAAAIGGVMALFASLPKFANGGIVSGGSLSGDNTLARVNKGEMILNMSQQSKLFKLANSGNLSSNNRNLSVSGDIRLRGSDLYASLKNYLKITGKKL